MKKFKFSMLRVLDVKESMKKSKELDVKKANIELNKQKEILSNINKEISDYINIKTNKNLTREFLMQRERYLSFLKTKQQQQQYNVNQAKANVATAITHLKEAVIEVKKVDKIKDKEFKKWKYEFNRDEQKITDEAGSRSKLLI